MELRFVALALRKLWWLIAVFAVLGIILARSLSGASTGQYESQALLLVRPSTSSVSPALASQPDRYVLSQISVLESTALAESVGNVLGGDETALTVRRSTKFVQRDETDIVVVTATTSDAVRSQKIAQAYASTYVNQTVTRTEALFAPERVRLLEELASVESELDDVNATLAAAAAPYLATLNSDTPVPVPDIRVLSPAAATRQSLLLEDIQRINNQLNNLELAARESVQSEIIQSAPVPDNPLSNSNGLLRMAIVIIMALAGAVVALVAARFSPTIIDEGDIEASLDQPIEARVPFVAGVAGSPEFAVAEDSRKWRSELDQLASRVELASNVDGARIVAVGGSTLGAGSSTLAIGLAARFAQRGSRTILIDADTTSATVTSALGAPTELHLADIANRRPDTLGGTALPNLITLGTSVGQSGRRVDGRDIAASLRTAADIVVIDVGPVLDSVSAAQLASGIDQLVLAVPHRGQRHDGIEQIRRVFSSFTEQLLPVTVSTKGGFFSKLASTKSRPTPTAEPRLETVKDAA